MTTPYDEYDDQYRHVARTWASDPKHLWSWRREFDDQGRDVACTWANDPKHPKSWRREYDDQDRQVATTFANDPKHPDSWRSVRVLGTIEGYDIHVLDDDRVKVGCQTHDLETWADQWQEIAEGEDEGLDIAEAEALELLEAARKVIGS